MRSRRGAIGAHRDASGWEHAHRIAARACELPADRDIQAQTARYRKMYMADYDLTARDFNDLMFMVKSDRPRQQGGDVLRPEGDEAAAMTAMGEVALVAPHFRMHFTVTETASSTAV